MTSACAPSEFFLNFKSQATHCHSNPAHRCAISKSELECFRESHLLSVRSSSLRSFAGLNPLGGRHAARSASRRPSRELQERRLPHATSRRSSPRTSDTSSGLLGAIDTESKRRRNASQKHSPNQIQEIYKVSTNRNIFQKSKIQKVND